jgi:hypothetical protein
LSGQSPDTSAFLVAAFHKGLNEAGYVEGRNVAIEYRWALGRNDRLPTLAEDLVSRQVAVIAATAGGGTAASLAAKAATRTIPIIFTSGVDPVKIGLVASLNRPGGNVTGVTFLGLALDPKRLELLHEMVPNITTLGVLLNPNFPDAKEQLREVREAADARGLKVHILNASNIQEIDLAFDTFRQIRPEADRLGRRLHLCDRRFTGGSAGSNKQCKAHRSRQEFVQKPEPLTPEAHCHVSDAGHIAPRLVEASDQPRLDQVHTCAADDRNGSSSSL